MACVAAAAAAASAALAAAASALSVSAPHSPAAVTANACATSFIAPAFSAAAPATAPAAEGSAARSTRAASRLVRSAADASRTSAACTYRRACRSRGLCKRTSCTHIVLCCIRRVFALNGSLVIAPTTRFLGVTCLPSLTATVLLLGTAGRYTGRHLPALFSVPGSRGRHSNRPLTFGVRRKWLNERRPKAASLTNQPVREPSLNEERKTHGKASQLGFPLLGLARLAQVSFY